MHSGSAEIHGLVGAAGVPEDRTQHEKIYGYLQRFCCETYEVSTALLDNLLRFDALLADGGRIRPENLGWNRERCQALTASFWKGMPSVVQPYIPLSVRQ